MTRSPVLVILFSGIAFAGEVERLAQDLRYGTEPVRVQAALMLGRSKEALALPVLLQGLGDPVASVRAAAAEALGDLGDPIAITLLVQTLGDVAQVGASALKSLGRLASGRAAEQARVIPVLMEALRAS
ncbi:MAG: HEAT repeat domain-containing protein, partial [bacterium]